MVTQEEPQEDLVMNITRRSESFTSTIYFDLENAPLITTSGAWLPTSGVLQISHPSNSHATMSLLLEGVRAWAIEAYGFEKAEKMLCIERYDYGLPYGRTRGGGENPVPSNLLVTDLPKKLQSMIEKTCDITIADYVLQAPGKPTRA